MAEGNRIQFADNEISPARTNGSSASFPHASKKASRLSSEVLPVEEGLAPQHDDFKKKQVFSGWTLAWLAYQSTGVIYGDIGTSPLYVYSSTFSDNPSYDDLLGALSIIIWTLTLMVSIKYVCIVLSADDEGEGGTFALYSLLSRYANISRRDPRELSMIKMERVLTSDLNRPGRDFRSMLEKSRFAKSLLKIVGIVGVSLVMADGVLTPAQSILGLNVIKPDISTGTIVGVSCAILVVLFAVQPFGTSKIASTFAPIVIIWLGFNLGFGIYNLVQFDHSVLNAFSPNFAIQYFVRNGTDGWKSLGGLLLAFTGVEALFADLGAFSKRSIQLSWLLFAFPCLLVAYIGQAAYIAVDPTAYSNPFFNTVPPGMFYPSLVISILAAIVASQAMITSTFQILSQAMALSYFPQIKMIHTSKIFYGQIYIPWANWLLLVGSIIVTVVYHDTTRLGNAYGVCVIMVTFITTCMVSIVSLIIWRRNVFIVITGFLIFGALDSLYLSAALTKVPDGAWFTLVLGAIISSVFILWRFGKEQQWNAEGEDRINPSVLVEQGPGGVLKLSRQFGDGEITPIKGIGIFFDKVGDFSPVVWQQFLRKFEAQPEITVFFHMRPLSTPSVPLAERFSVERLSLPHTYRLRVRHGYNDEVISSDLGNLVFAQLSNFLIHSTARPSPSTSTAVESGEKSTAAAASVSTDLEQLNRAYEAQVVYIVGKEQMRIRHGTNVVRKLLLNMFLWLRENTRGRIAAMKIPVDRLVEVGFIKEV
ncbi:MAG: hypothetical protein M1829_001263 [Trizodia sp. TS-e1964]|nr:MAG: hypothetical protein M1829_001263 [Trizodia sp. TS-e1964]